MAYKCLECGHIFEDGEEAAWPEYRGDCFGVESYEVVRGCPLCKGEFEKTIPCAICGSEHLEDELNGGVCDECIDSYRNDFDTCIKVSDGEYSEIKINALLATLFEPADIEQILKEYVREKMPNADCSDFIDGDLRWFGEHLRKEVKKNENKKK